MKKNLVLTSLLGFLICPYFSNAMDDSEYEKRLYNIYLKHYKDPISNSDWNQKVKALSQKKHKLKFKDNLWDLSGSFFKDSLYWSKLWVANPKVENPHLIYQGDFIKFDPQTLADVNKSKYSVDIESQFSGLIIPKNEFNKPALSELEIPSSLSKIDIVQAADHGIDVSKLQDINTTNETIVPFYLNEGPSAGIGEVVNKDGYGKFISTGGEQLIVRINDDISINSIFTVFENRSQFESIFSRLLTTLKNENEIMIRGKIKILSYIKGSDSLYLASVIESLKTILPGNLIMAGESPIYEFSQKGPIGSGSGLIVGTPNRSKFILSVGSIVYLNRGKSDGIHKGNFFYVRQKARESKGFKRPYKHQQTLLGKLKVIHAIENMATGIIVEARDQILVGDIFTDNLDSIADLDDSQDHEAIEEAETLEQGKELLIDFEEVPENTDTSLESEDQELDIPPDELENYEEIEEADDEEIEEFDEEEMEEVDDEEIEEFDEEEMEEVDDEEIEEFDEEKIEEVDDEKMEELDESIIDESIQPTSPEMDDLTSPEMDDLTSPEMDDLTPPEMDDLTSPEMDDLTSPEMDDLTSPEMDELTPPEMDDLTPPEMDDLTPPETDDLTSPELDDLTPPETDDLTSPETDDLTSPEMDDLTPPEMDDLTSPEMDDLTSPEMDDLTPPEMDDLTSPEMDDLTSPEMDELTEPATDTDIEEVTDEEVNELENL